MPIITERMRVYVGYPDFSLSGKANDFSETNLKKAVALARKTRKKNLLYAQRLRPREAFG